MNKCYSSLRCLGLILLFLIYFSLGQAISQETSTFTISGYIDDSSSREILIGATVYCPETNTGVYTNVYGFFSLTLPAKAKTIQVSYVGYETLKYELDGKSNSKLLLHLKSSGQLEEVVVTADKKTMSSPNTGALKVPISIVKTAPSLFGESDLMKTLQLLPGVQAGSEGSAGVYVRGGGPDENLILLDGISLYNVDHLAGFFSVFTPESVKNVKLYKGSFPARFGGRLSSVIDVRTNDGNMQSYHGSFTVGLIASKLQVEGPIVKNRTSFNLSLRRTYADLLIAPFLRNQDAKGGYYFYDTNLKLQHRLTDKDRLFLSVYHGMDKFHGEDKSKRYDEDFEKESSIGLKWGNTLASLRWSHTFTPKLYSNLTTSYTYYFFNFGSQLSVFDRQNLEKSGYDAKYLSGIHDYNTSWDFDYYLNNKYKFHFGSSYTLHNFRPEAVVYEPVGANKEEFDKLLDKIKLPESRSIMAHEMAVYAENEMHFNKYLMLNLGLRLSDFYVQGANYFSWEPRAIFEYRPIQDLQLQLSYTKMSQNIHLLTSANMTLPSDLWVPATKSIEPMTAHQYSFGTIYNGLRGWEFSIDCYYKDMRNVLEYKDDASFLGSSLGWEDKVEMGQGRAYGVELLAMRTRGKITGWLGYTIAKSERLFPNGKINFGKWFPYKYDRRHHVNLVLSYKINKVVDLSASWEFHSGGFITAPTGKFVTYPDKVLNPEDNTYYVDSRLLIESRNNYQVPPTHKLNLSCNFNCLHKSGNTSIWNLSIYNAYNSMNPSFVFPEYDGKLFKFTLLPIIPSVSYTYKF